MNGNVPHAARVIRTVLATVRSEQAAAVAHALDSARLLVDPERSFGVVLYRTPDGGWSRTARPVTELERQALGWDASCARARHVASAVERHLDTHPGPHAVRVEGDRVRVVLRVDGPGQWARWRSYFGVTSVGERTEPHTLTGEGERDGVRVTVVARTAVAPPPDPADPAAPTAPAGSADTEAADHRRYRIGETLYDLAAPMRDVYGGIWYFEGRRNGDGMPLMALDGRPERCSLANVAVYLGPLSPVRPGHDVTASGPTGVPAASPAPPDAVTPSDAVTSSDVVTPPDVVVPWTRRVGPVPHVLPSAVPPLSPDGPGAWAPAQDPHTAVASDGPGPWANLDVSETGGPQTGGPPDLPRPRATQDPRDLRTVPQPPEPEHARAPEPMPEQARDHPRAREPEPAAPWGPAEAPGPPGPVEPAAPTEPALPVEPSYRADRGEPFGPLVPAVPTAGPAGPVR
ncbi:BN159_2729 family protein [Streptomyces sp. MBT97]|uniref:BN159_2729 family protein n=1 Tax=Streptomyces sp. MBT97 TaxID=2800411 RepID=UPI0027DCAFEB|nr:BN159_2729 family protein [Streptomyces sp. MBT97]